MHYYGAVYRPPSEAYSLIVQCTLGCSHNKCAFCNMYKDKKFSIRPVEEVLRDLAEARSYERRIERIFLADGDALILPMDYLRCESKKAKNYPNHHKVIYSHKKRVIFCFSAFFCIIIKIMLSFSEISNRL